MEGPQARLYLVSTRSCLDLSESLSLLASPSCHLAPPPPNQDARKRNRASRHPIANDNDNHDESRYLEEDALDSGMKGNIGYQSRPEMEVDMDTEFEVSFVRGEMIGHHQERKECTILQLPEPSWYVIVPMHSTCTITDKAGRHRYRN